MDAAVAALAGFTDRMTASGVQHYRAVATSAVRESKNGDEFVERIAARRGSKLEVISGSEEARLVHMAVARWCRWAAGAGCWWTSAAAASRSRWWIRRHLLDRVPHHGLGAAARGADRGRR